jgi:Flp pilus assembly protein TadG
MVRFFTKSSRGQIVVLFAVILVVLLGFTALAIDSSVIYSDRRAAQNAADAAALAGAGMAAQNMENLSVIYDNFSCSNPNVINAMGVGVNVAINRAATNNYTIDNDVSDKNGVKVTCARTDIGPYVDNYVDISVWITAPSNTSFAHLFYSGPIKVTAQSIVRVHPRTNLGFGYAVAAMGTNCSTGGLHGNGNTTIHSDHAGVFSNSCWDFANGKTHVYVNDPGGSGCRYYSGTVNPNWCSVPLVQSPVQLKPYLIPAPECKTLPTYGSVSGGTINPGNYSGINVGSHGTLTMNPGLYCFTGNVYFGAQATVVGNGVTLYFMNNAGFTVTAGAQMTLSAPLSNGYPAIDGLLIYGAPGNSGTIEMGGHAASNYRGTVYMPDGTIILHGTPQMEAVECQLVGKKVTLEGTSDIYIDYSGATNYQIPAIVDQLK